MAGFEDLAGRELLPTRRPVSSRTPAAIDNAMQTQGMTSNAWLGPGAPMRPRAGYSQRPRATDYPTGVNLSIEGRTTWGRTAFTAMKSIIDASDVVRACINHKIDEIRSMEPMFIPADGVNEDVDAAIDAARAAMAFPDRENPFDAWTNMLFESALRYDAAALYNRRNYDGDVIALEVLDGTTIVPLIDEHGRRPEAPAPAFAQKIHGQVDTLLTRDDVVYRPFRPQSDNPYGLAPIESVLLGANTDLRFQWHFLQLFTDGSVPAGFMELPDDISSPDQVEEWQDYWDAFMQGDQAILHRIIGVPARSKFTETRPKTFDKQFPIFLTARICAAFGVVPQDLGFIEDVNRANGETQTGIQFRVNTLPWVRWFEGIVTRYLQVSLGLPVKMALDTGRDKVDRLADAQAWKVYVETGAASPDEMRQELLGLEVDNDRPIPRGIISNRVGFIPFNSVLAISGKVDPETAAPSDDAILPTVGFEGTPSLISDKLPGGAVFQRAPINPDIPDQPDLQHPVEGTDIAPIDRQKAAQAAAAAPQPASLAKAHSIGETIISEFERPRALRTSDEAPAEPEEAPELAALQKAELAAFRRYTKGAVKRRRWRDFTFTAVKDVEAHRLNDQARAAFRKSTGELVAAGLVLRAADTGRVLMLQREYGDGTPAAGKWEFPGGHIEDSDLSASYAATREWAEETGLLLPRGTPSHAWTSSDGVYAGYLLTIPSENYLDIHTRQAGTNPDDPDGDIVEALAWWPPTALPGNPVIRGELQRDIDVVVTALLACECCGGSGEHDTGRECYGCDASGQLKFFEGSLPCDGAAPEDDASPLVKGWRDTDNVTPQMQYDLQLTDHYAPAIQSHLTGIVDQVDVEGIVKETLGQVTDGTVDFTESARTALQSIGVDTSALATTLERLYVDSWTVGQHAAGTQLDNPPTVADTIDWSTWAPGNPPAADTINSAGLTTLLADRGITVQGITDTTLDTIGGRIADGLTAGDAPATIARDIRDLVGSRTRAERIAHTETARALTDASMEVYALVGVTQWDLIVTAGACAVCLAEESRNPHPIGDSTGRPPLHPFCRCAASPRPSSIDPNRIQIIDEELDLG